MSRFVHKTTAAIVLTLMPGAASAGGIPVKVSAAAAGGYTFATQQPWTGVDIAVHSYQQRGFGMSGRMVAGVNLFDVRPAVSGELGLNGVVPDKNAIIRLGVAGGGQMTFANYPLPVQAPGELTVDGFGLFGFIPYGVITADIDLRWTDRPRAPESLTIGLRAGVGSISGVVDCIDEAASAEEGRAVGTLCDRWVPGFIGGFVGRLVLRNGFFLEAEAGPSPRLAIGYAF